MKYEIKGLNLPYVEITLERGEKIHTERGGMSWMSETMDMKTNAGEASEKHCRGLSPVNRCSKTSIPQPKTAT